METRKGRGPLGDLLAVVALVATLATLVATPPEPTCLVERQGATAEATLADPLDLEVVGYRLGLEVSGYRAVLGPDHWYPELEVGVRSDLPTASPGESQLGVRLAFRERGSAAGGWAMGEALFGSDDEGRGTIYVDSLGPGEHDMLVTVQRVEPLAGTAGSGAPISASVTPRAWSEVSCDADTQPVLEPAEVWHTTRSVQGQVRLDPSAPAAAPELALDLPADTPPMLRLAFRVSSRWADEEVRAPAVKLVLEGPNGAELIAGGVGYNDWETNTQAYLWTSAAELCSDAPCDPPVSLKLRIEAPPDLEASFDMDYVLRVDAFGFGAAPEPR